jgi:chromate reductase, NAD(P)H dehydrogenase (quinone)
MKGKRQVVAICGSTKKLSLNLSLIQAIGDLFEQEIDLRVITDIDKLPHFNPDLDHQSPPASVTDLRNKLSQAEGILICTPEYAMGVSGTLKNALDWMVSTTLFSKKPVALITASSQGQKGHAALLETLKVIESNITEETQLVISFVKTKVKDDRIIDRETEKLVKGVVSSLLKLMDGQYD